MIDDVVREALLPIFPAGTQVIIMHENGPRPPGVYVALRVENVRKMPAHIGSLAAPDPIPALGTRVIAAHRSGSVEIQCYGEGSFDLLDLALQRLHTEAAIETAEALDMAFGTASQLQSIPALRNESEFEPRAVATLPFAYTRWIDERIAVIETVEATVQVDDLPPMPFSATIVDN